jgi:hypothetical protein
MAAVALADAAGAAAAALEASRRASAGGGRCSASDDDDDDDAAPPATAESVAFQLRVLRQRERALRARSIQVEAAAAAAARCAESAATNDAADAVADAIAAADAAAAAAAAATAAAAACMALPPASAALYRTQLLWLRHTWCLASSCELFEDMSIAAAQRWEEAAAAQQLPPPGPPTHDLLRGAAEEDAAVAAARPVPTLADAVAAERALRAAAQLRLVPACAAALAQRRRPAPAHSHAAAAAGLSPAEAADTAFRVAWLAWLWRTAAAAGIVPALSARNAARWGAAAAAPQPHDVPTALDAHAVRIARKASPNTWAHACANARRKCLVRAHAVLCVCYLASAGRGAGGGDADRGGAARGRGRRQHAAVRAQFVRHGRVNANACTYVLWKSCCFPFFVYPSSASAHARVAKRGQHAQPLGQPRRRRR